MKLLCSILTLLSLTILVNAQDNFKPGYVITNNNDSILGLIDFKTDDINSTVCHFKESENAPGQFFYPGDIAKYRFTNEGKYYISRQVTIDSVSRLVFLEYLIDGTMKLYYYRVNSELDYYFFEDNTGKLISITKKPDKYEKSNLVTDKKYIGYLNYLFRDFPTITGKIDKNTQYNRASMIKLTKEYHELTCSPGEKCIEFENDYKKQYAKLKFSVYGGARIIDYTYYTEKEGVVRFNNNNTTRSLFPEIGCQLNLSSPRLTSALSAQLDVAFSGIKGESEYSNVSIYQKYTFDAMSAQGRFNLKYTYPYGKFRPTAEGGLSFCGLFSKSGSFYSETRYTLDDLTSNTKDNYILQPSDFWGFNCAIGMDFEIMNDKFIILRVVYERVTNFDIINSGQLKLGYTF